MRYILGLLFLLFGSVAFGQTDADTSKKQTVIVDGDTFTITQMDPVVIQQSLDADKVAEYQRLKRRVKKVMPYAKMAAYKMQVMEDNLALKTTRKERKKYIKECEKSMKELYTQQLKDLSIEEGKVLMKLIHRETGKTTWQIMKNYRGTTEAIFWQAFGSVYGHDMTAEYDPAVDYQIEHIIKILELE